MMDVFFFTSGHSSGGAQGVHARDTVRQWLASVPNMYPHGAYNNVFAMYNVEENPSAVIASLKGLLTPEVLAHMHSNSIWSSPEIADLKEYNFIDLHFNDLISDLEWSELMRERRSAVANIAQVPDDLIPWIQRYLH